MSQTTKCEKCGFDIHNRSLKRHALSCNGLGPRHLQPPKEHRCKFCSKELPPKSVGAHVVSCGLNPKRKETLQKQKQTATGKKLSEEHKEKLSKVVRKKVSEGTWHLSFSHSRTHEYKGVKFHGMWEVKYAKFLDDNGIVWRRPTEKFKYEFEGKSSYYTPDFFLLEEKVYVEIKGYKTPKDEAKWRQFPLELKVLLGKDLIQLGILQESEVKTFRCSSMVEQTAVESGSSGQE